MTSVAAPSLLASFTDSYDVLGRQRGIGVCG